MNNQGLSSVQLVRRPAVEKPGVFHYAVELGARTAALIGRHRRGIVVELKPAGLSFEPSETQSGWSPVVIAADEAGAVARLRELATDGMTYDLVKNNCEHFARYVVTGKRESIQVDFLKVLAFATGLALLLSLASEAT
jgi:hypothetical protein